MTLKWEGRMDQLKGKARKLWGVLTDDELDQAKGDYERTIGIIKEKTGLAAEEVERRLAEGEDLA
jgi:uncharacterized protein YjbJ (UPF0337 family)